MLYCTKCGGHFYITMFRKDYRYKDGRHPWCMTCESKAAIERKKRKKNKNIE